MSTFDKVRKLRFYTYFYYLVFFKHSRCSRTIMRAKLTKTEQHLNNFIETQSKSKRSKLTIASSKMTKKHIIITNHQVQR